MREPYVGFQQVGVMQSYRGLLADAGKEKQIIFVELRAVGLVDYFNYAQNFIVLAKRRAHPGLNFEISPFFNALRERGFLAGILEQFGVGLLCDIGEKTFV